MDRESWPEPGWEWAWGQLDYTQVREWRDERRERGGRERERERERGEGIGGEGSERKGEGVGWRERERGL